MYALVDCNNFYASCERVFKPDLNGKPIGVLSNNDGCIIARSEELKVLGVKMGVPFFQIKELIRKHDIYIASSNYELYGDLSNRVMSILQTFSPETEVYSIDECFLKFTGFESYFDYRSIGQEMRYKCQKWLSIPVSVGFAPTKALTKVANKIAKKFPKETNGVYIIDTEEKRIKALQWTKIEDVWGIGGQYKKLMHANNVFNAYQFTQKPDGWITKHMTVLGLRLKMDLCGIPTIEMEDVQDKKSITCSRSFEENYSELGQIQERGSTFSAIVGEKLRKQKSHCNIISVFLRSNAHRPDLEQHRSFINIKTDYPTNSTLEINRLVQKCLKGMFKQGIQYKKAGLIVSGLTPAASFQTKLFGLGEDPRHIDLMRTIDEINRKTKGKVLFGQNDQRRHKMRQEKLSPCYTTRMEDILSIGM